MTRILPRRSSNSTAGPLLLLRRASNYRNPGGGFGSGRPPRHSRLFGFLDGIPQPVVFWGIVGANAIVYLMWNYAAMRAQVDRQIDWLMWMRQNFTCSFQNYQEGRFWTLLTACFSHQTPAHLMFNGLTFFFMANPVLRLLGNRAFLALYLGGGIVSSMISIAWNHWRGTDIYSHGASGAVYSIVSFFACLAPNTKFLIFFIIPLPAWVCVGGLFTWDLLNALSNKRTGIDEAGHIGGMLGGVLYYLRWIGRI